MAAKVIQGSSVQSDSCSPDDTYGVLPVLCPFCMAAAGTMPPMQRGQMAPAYTCTCCSLASAWWLLEQCHLCREAKLHLSIPEPVALRPCAIISTHTKRAVHTCTIRMLVAVEMWIWGWRPHSAQDSTKPPGSRTHTRIYQSCRKLKNQFTLLRTDFLEPLNLRRWEPCTYGAISLVQL